MRIIILLATATAYLLGHAVGVRIVDVAAVIAIALMLAANDRSTT